jgi:acyl-CoA hydrolase
VTVLYDDVGECVTALLALAGPRLNVGMPIGIGKPIPLANELYRRALRDPAIELTFVTGLSLSIPRASSSLQRRFLEPFVARVFGDAAEPAYLQALRDDTLPPNIKVIEFFLEPGAALDWPHSQLQHLSTNYTQVARDLLARGVNVILQLVATRNRHGQRQISLGSNPDVTLDLLDAIEASKATDRPILLVGQTHPRMPFMLGHAQVEASRFDLLLEHERYDNELFCPPNLALSLVDHAIGLHASALSRDGGTLQIGIGELGDAIVYALQLRHQQNDTWRAALGDIGGERSTALIDAVGGRDRFLQGLFGCSEMFVDQLLDLQRAGVLRRRVFDCLPLERALATGAIGERFEADVLDRLLDCGLAPLLDARSFASLQACGVFVTDARFERDEKRGDGIRLPDGTWTGADLSDRATRARLAANAIGRMLQGGAVLQAGFLLGPKGFYAALRDLPDSERALFDMRGVAYINQLDGADRELRVLQRRDARFINSTMMVTLLGAAVSDGLADGRVVSGVGGQYNFVAMGHGLAGARSILCVRATRDKGGRTRSNLVFSYGHVTIPRHLRDIVITEYGSADLRGRTDCEVVAALLNIADSRFQPALLAEAKRHGKIARDYVIPEHHRFNTPQQLRRGFAAHRNRGLFSEFPFGSEFSGEEILLARALKLLAVRTARPVGRLLTVLRALTTPPRREQEPCLARMGLGTGAGTGRDGWLDRQLLRYALGEIDKNV